MDEAVQIIFDKFETSDTFASKLNAFRDCEQIVEFVRWFTFESSRMFVCMQLTLKITNVIKYNHIKECSQRSKKSLCLDRTYWLYGDDYRVGTLSKL